MNLKINEDEVNPKLKSVINTSILDDDSEEIVSKEIEPEAIEAAAEQKNYIPINKKLVENKYNPRLTIANNTDFIEFKKSIETQGQKEAIVITKHIDPKLAKKGQNIIVSGHCRVEALKQLGIKKVWYNEIKVSSWEELCIITWHYNKRNELTLIGKAKMFKDIQNDLKLNNAQLGKKFEIDRSVISRLIALFSLPDEVQLLLDSNNGLTLGHCSELTPLEDQALIINAANKVVKNNWTVTRLKQYLTTSNKEDDEQIEHQSSIDIKDIQQKFINKYGAGKATLKVSKSANKNILYLTDDVLESITKLIDS